MPNTIHTILQDAGWNPGRSIDTGNYELLLQKQKLPVVPAAIKIIQEFGGLRLAGTSEYTKTAYTWVDFDPEFACDIQSEEFLRAIGTILKKPVSPVGVAVNGEWILLAGANGHIYANHDLDIYFVADEIFKALQILCTRDRKKIKI